eukprot:SAG11_NODE_520_length_8780_cov_13.076719_1_plen_119_part_00
MNILDLNYDIMSKIENIFIERDRQKRNKHLDEIRKFEWKVADLTICHTDTDSLMFYKNKYEGLRASGYVYEDRFILMDEYCGPYSHNILGVIPLRCLDIDLSQDNVVQVFIEGEDCRC